MKRMRYHKKSKGVTLVETMVASAMLLMLLAMVGGALSPAYAVFRRNLEMQRAKIIADNILRELRGCMREAYGLVKIYNISGDCPDLGADSLAGSGNGVKGAASGNVLEFMHRDGYVFVVTADGAPGSYMRYDNGIPKPDPVAAIPKGIMSVRRYKETNKDVVDRDLKSYLYEYIGTVAIDGVEAKKTVVRDMYAPFSKDYYMGMDVSILFSFPEGAGAGTDVKYVEAAVTVSKGGRVIAKETAFLDLRYVAKRTDAVTAE